MKIFLLILLCLALTSSFNLFNLRNLTTKNGASCMDGSPAVIYLFQPQEQYATNKLLIMFQQNFQGWCVKENLNSSITRCYHYLNQQNLINYGTSKNYPGSIMFLQGILSPDSQFANWYKVLVKTCDGGLYFGDNQIKFRGEQLKFKGHQNFVQAINLLNSLKYLANRDEIVLAGMLNGGLAALMWSQYVQTFTSAKVKVILDCAINLNVQNQISKTDQFQNRMRMIEKLFFKDKYELPNKKCQEANKDQVWKCFFPQILINFVSSDIKIYISQSLYDGWSILNVLGFDCAEDFGSLSECTQQHKAAIDVYHQNVTKTMNQLAKLKNVNIFGIACVAHYFLSDRFANQQFTVPMQTTNTVQLLVWNWIKNKGQGNWTHIENIQWPHNTPCARKLGNQKYHLNGIQ